MRQDVSERPMRAWICVLLALLILYNPFLALTSSCGSYSVQGQARHRATVGASELQHLGCAQDQTPQDVENLQEFGQEFAGPAVEYQAVAFHEDVEVAQPALASLIWSRPPPLV
ncbi:MAG TPA: hypothetical protein VLX60_00150 [Terriglobales bacterium]|nr:hypothetical protein [Terriglobales bacterium]